MQPTRNLVACSIAALVLVSASLGYAPSAQAGEVRGTVIEYRLSQGKDLYRMIGDVKVPIIELELRGTAKLFDSQVDLRWTVEDAEPYLKLITACSGGRLTVQLDADYESGDKKIEGKGPIRDLYCRTILR